MMTKHVPGYEGLYTITLCGRVFSLDRTVPHARWGTQTRKGKELVQRVGTRGYRYVALSKDGKATSYNVHRLMGKTYFDVPEDMCINHINGIKTDNRITNLEVVTLKENVAHAIELGLVKYEGKDNPNYRHGRYING